MFIIICGYGIEYISNEIINNINNTIISDPSIKLSLDLINILFPDYIIYIYEDGSKNKEQFIYNELFLDKISHIIPIYKVNGLDTKEFILSCIHDIFNKNN